MQHMIASSFSTTISSKQKSYLDLIRCPTKEAFFFRHRFLLPKKNNLIQLIEEEYKVSMASDFLHSTIGTIVLTTTSRDTATCVRRKAAASARRLTAFILEDARSF